MNFISLNKLTTARELSVLKRVNDHLEESLEHFHPNQIVFIALQGSQNYDLDVEGSDVDTKLILVPSLNDLIFNKKAVSTTHVRENDEHTDWKDLRLIFQTFRKQNLNFVEVLYSPWVFINETYLNEIKPLFDKRELIARYNPAGAVKTMRGIALEKYHAMEHRYPSKIEIIDKYGYDPKQLHHLARVSDFLDRYINGYTYEECLHPVDREYLKWLKTHAMPLDAARDLANSLLEGINETSDKYRTEHPETALPEGEELLNTVQEKIMRKAIGIELNG